MLADEMLRQTHYPAVISRFLCGNVQLDIGDQKRTRRIVCFQMFLLGNRRFQQPSPLESNVFL